MTKKTRAACARRMLLAIAFTLLLTGCHSTGEDTPEEKAIKAQVNAIKAVGGKVMRTNKGEGNPIGWVSFSGTKVTDAGLKELVGIKNAALMLDLDNTKVTDTGLKELASIESLVFLNLENTAVTDAGLKELAGHKKLQRLNLTATKVTDAGLKELLGISSLQILTLNGTKVTDAGVAEMRKAVLERTNSLPLQIILHSKTITLRPSHMEKE